MRLKVNGNWRRAAISIFALASFAAFPSYARQIGEDEWIDVGAGSNGDTWSIQSLSVINFQQNQGTNLFGKGGHAWIKIVRKNGGAYRKVYWAIGCSEKAYFTVSRVAFSKTGTQLSRWDNSRTTAPRDFPKWSFAAPGTIESRVIGAFCLS